MLSKGLNLGRFRKSDLKMDDGFDDRNGAWDDDDEDDFDDEDEFAADFDDDFDEEEEDDSSDSDWTEEDWN
ncbi:hypothetical protein IIA29_03795 [candidate division KSB1 bacterium]|nr:hypothetical protein [candidate division KSB1 bacterium]